MAVGGKQQRLALDFPKVRAPCQISQKNLSTLIVERCCDLSPALLRGGDIGRYLLCILHETSGVTAKLVSRFSSYESEQANTRGSVLTVVL